MSNNTTNMTSIIKVIGVGGGGSNAVNFMFNQGIKDVDFLVCNTDRQALEISPVPFKIQLGKNLTEGRGAGMMPEVGMNAAIENIDELREVLSANTKMVFVTAGMGGGTGTGAAPVIAQVAKELGILTVGIVTLPFDFDLNGPPFRSSPLTFAGPTRCPGPVGSLRTVRLAAMPSPSVSVPSGARPCSVAPPEKNPR